MPPTRKTTKLTSPPQGFQYEDAFLSPSEQADLSDRIEVLPLKEFEFHGYFGKRRTLSFGWHYSFADGSLNKTETIPDFLLPARDRAADFAGLNSSDLPHVLITEYSPGTPIGWHRDKIVFHDVIGISLLASCPFRLRRKTVGGWERYTHTLQPRSVYLLRGVVRNEWEHSIPPVESLRYSITFRSLS